MRNDSQEHNLDYTDPVWIIMDNMICLHIFVLIIFVWHRNWVVVDKNPHWKIWTSVGAMKFPIFGKTRNVPNHQPGIISPEYPINDHSSPLITFNHYHTNHHSSGISHWQPLKLLIGKDPKLSAWSPLADPDWCTISLKKTKYWVYQRKEEGPFILVI